MDCELGDSGGLPIFNALGATMYHAIIDDDAHAKRLAAARVNVGVATLGVAGPHLPLPRAPRARGDARPRCIPAFAPAKRGAVSLARGGAAGNGISDVAAPALGLALSVNRTLRSVDVSRNRVGDAAAAELAEALKVNSCLTELRMHDNLLGDAGGTALSLAAPRAAVLQTLDLSCNPGMSFMVPTHGFVAASLDDFPNDLNLVPVSVERGGRTGEGYRQDVSRAAEQGKAARPLELFDVISTALVSLVCAENSLGTHPPAAHAPLQAFLRAATRLCELRLPHNALTADHVRALSLTAVALLDLGHNALGNAGADALLKQFKNMRAPQAPPPPHPPAPSTARLPRAGAELQGARRAGSRDASRPPTPAAPTGAGPIGQQDLQADDQPRLPHQPRGAPPVMSARPIR